MSNIVTKKVVSKRKKRNFIAKKLLSEPMFKPKVILDKRRVSKEDRKNLDEWLARDI